MENLFLAVGLIAAVASGVIVYRSGGRYGERGDDPRIRREYDPRTGQLRMLVYDANENFKADTWSYLENDRVVRMEVDEDEDGIIDRWYFYGPDELVQKEGFSTKSDGKVDAWRYERPDGTLEKIEYSARRNGIVTRTELYENGLLSRVEERPLGAEEAVAVEGPQGGLGSDR